jgi:hypothetical protein
MSVVGSVVREVSRARMARIAQRLIMRLAMGNDTPTIRDRAEHYSRGAALLGDLADQYRLAGVLFHRVVVEEDGAESRSRRTAESLFLLDVLVDQHYAPALEFRDQVLACLPIGFTADGVKPTSACTH